MNIDEAIKKRMISLITDAAVLRQANEYGAAGSDLQKQKCKAWIVAASNIIKSIYPDQNNSYHIFAQRIIKDDYGYTIPQEVGSIAETLTQIYEDMELGLVKSIFNRVRAEVFDDFLDHAKEYIKTNSKNEAGVISGVVFEDTIRRISRDNSITEKDVKLDDVISTLTKANIITQIKAKRARAAAHVRTKATHAQWDEYEIEDVKATIEFTEELINTFLDK
jgi:hypothetical protein